MACRGGILEGMSGQVDSAMLAAGVFLFSLCPVSTVAQGDLFESAELLHVRIEAPFRRLTSDVGERFAATLIFAQAPEDTIDLEISARGKSRLESNICEFPGLMLFFTGGAVGTAFEGQGPVPVVTHCRDRDSYEQLALLEFLAYRTYNAVTRLSLRVRLARFEYYDSERGRLVADRFGFFLENYDVFAALNEFTRLKVRLVHPTRYQIAQRTLFEVFQYFIGNTDWSYILAPPDESECCHNVVPVGPPGGPLYPIPFDFDQAGLVDAPYATVDPSVPIRNVRERRFRGICGEPRHLDVALGTFEVQESEIRALFEDASFLNERNRRRVLDYVEEFYGTIADERKVQREFLSKCRTP
jgi:hypothetical protein